MVREDDFKKLDGSLLFDNLTTDGILADFVESILKSVENQARLKTGCSDLVIIGIKEGGVPLAGLINKSIKSRFKSGCEIGQIDMTLYRDDPFSIKKPIKSTEMPLDIENKDIILVDDVISTGRTVRAAIDEIFDFGRPSSIKLAVFIDKGGRELPICPDFVGRKINSGKDELVRVDVISREKSVYKIIKK